MQSGKVQATFRIDIPQNATASGKRSAQYISPETAQMAINVEQGGVSIAGYPVTVALTPTSGGCTSTLGNTICQLTVSLEPGTYTATLTTEDANGNALSSAQSIAFTITAAADNVIPVIFSGIPRSLQIASGAQAVHGSGTSGLVLYGMSAQPVIVTALDADGNTIVGPGSPSFSASVVSGSGWSAGAPSSTTPNAIPIAPPGTNGSAAVFSVTASYPDATCAQPGAVCTSTFAIKNDIQTLFVANCGSRCPGGTGNGPVTVYAPPYTGTPTVISTGVNGAWRPALDAAGNLFVANDNNTVTEYAPPYTGAPTVISTDVSSPWALALNAAGDLFVGNYGTTMVTEYVPPYTGTPTVISADVDTPVALVLDAAGDLFAANISNGVVSEYAPPYTGSPTVIADVPAPYALALDAAGDLFVGDDFHSTVSEYAPPYTGSPTVISNAVNAPDAVLLTP